MRICLRRAPKALRVALQCCSPSLAEESVSEPLPLPSSAAALVASLPASDRARLAARRPRRHFRWRRAVVLLVLPLRLPPLRRRRARRALLLSRRSLPWRRLPPRLLLSLLLLLRRLCIPRLELRRRPLLRPRSHERRRRRGALELESELLRRRPALRLRLRFAVRLRRRSLLELRARCGIRPPCWA